MKIKDKYEKYAPEILHKECDKVMLYLFQCEDYKQDFGSIQIWFYEQIKLADYAEEYWNLDINVIICILLSDGFVHDVNKTGLWYALTAKGIAFMNTSSYAEREALAQVRKKAESRRNWKDIHWWLIIIITNLLSFISGLILNTLKAKS